MLPQIEIPKENKTKMHYPYRRKYSPRQRKQSIPRLLPLLRQLQVEVNIFFKNAVVTVFPANHILK